MSLNEAKKTASKLEKSFFDDPTPPSLFWKQIDASDFSNYSRSLENEFYVRSSKYFQTWDSCSLSIQNNFLVYRKKRTSKTVEYIDLDEHMYKIKVIYPDDSRNSVKYKHGFSVSANGQYFEFFCKEKSQLNKWLVYFRKMCVMADFHENYTTLETIGKGGYGEVRLLQDNATKTKRAGKFITISDGNDKKFSKQRIMVMNEIKILRKVDHPNIVKLYEIYEVGNEVCLIMEFIEGIHLLKYLTREKRLIEKETATIMKQLLLVLNYLASMDIIHRDIKSENIMLTRTKEGKLHIKLIDFGLSTFLYQRDAIKRCGTPGYVAPEVLHGDTYDCRVDLYSAGIIMFACLNGKPPFAAENYDELLEKNKKGIIVYKGKNWMQISSEGKNMIQKLLEPVTSRLTLEEAICHAWLQEHLSAEEKKHLNEYRFHIVKMNVPEETRISSVPINSTQVSKSAFNTDNNHNRYTSLNSFYLSKTFVNDPANRLNSFYKPSITRDLGGDESPTSLTKLKPQLLGGMQTLDISGMKNRHNLLDLSSTITPSYRDGSEMTKSRGEVRDKEDISIMKFPVQRLSDCSFEELIPDDRPTCGDRYKELANLTHCFSKLNRQPAGYCLKSGY